MKKKQKTSCKFVCFLLLGLLSSCKPSNEKMIIGIWANDYPYSSNAMFEWMEFKKEGYTVDENGFSFSYSVHDNHILFKDEALEIVKLDKDVLLLKSEKKWLMVFS